MGSYRWLKIINLELIFQPWKKKGASLQDKIFKDEHLTITCKRYDFYRPWEKFYEQEIIDSMGQLPMSAFEVCHLTWSL